MKLLVTGAGGLLGSAVAHAAADRGHEVLAGLRPGGTRVEVSGRATELDVTDGEAVERTFDEEAPDAVVHCAAYTDVRRAEAEPHAAMGVNLDGTRTVALAAAAAGSFLLYPSSCEVFSGTKEGPYLPDDPPDPVNAYGRSKKAGEDAIRKAARRWMIVRTSWLYGAGGPNFVDRVLERGRTEEVVEVDARRRGRPTWTGSLGVGLVELLETVVVRPTPVGGVASEGPAASDAEEGRAASESERILHLTDRGEATRYELAREAYRLRGIATPLVPARSEEGEGEPERPRNAVLDPGRAEERLGRRMPHWQESLRAYLGDRR